MYIPKNFLFHGYVPKNKHIVVKILLTKRKETFSFCLGVYNVIFSKYYLNSLLVIN